MLAVVLVASNFISSINDRETSQIVAAQHIGQPSLALGPAATGPPASPSQALPPTTVGQVLPAVIAAVNALPRQRGIPASLSPPVAELLSDYPHIPPSCEAHEGETSASVCRFGAIQSPRRVVIIGDSHAEMWLPALLRDAQQRGWAVLPVLKSACTPAFWTGSLGPADCHQWFPWAMRTALALHPAITLIAGLYSGSGAYQQILNGLDAAVRAQRKGPGRVIIIGDVPERNAQPVDCLLARNAGLANCSDTLSVSEAQFTSEVAQLAAGQRARFIDTTGWFCYEGACPLVVDNVIAYRDNNHVSQAYSGALGGALWADMTAQ